ncbi:hypothetical protein N5C67_23485 [Comamonas thiooxydans]|uniref:hypothetical protein n=1 Tax=Comamonas thiooxydans TaxID=363952 RepID=UPI00244CC194|nr:hypothetical protein [Comamonas thiooxydans]MDH1255610.1 hypothetical protein [Comamonas thiooxydans]
MNLTGKDKEIYDRLFHDLNNLDRKISKQQLLKQFDQIYSKWFSNQADIETIRRNFEVDIDSAEQVQVEDALKLDTSNIANLRKEQNQQPTAGLPQIPSQRLKI